MAEIKKKIRMKKKSGGNNVISYPQTVDDNVLVDDGETTLREKLGGITGQIEMSKNGIAEVKGFIGYTDDDIYGLEADFENSKFTRLAGAVGKTGGADFDNVNCYGGRRRCIVTNNGKILAYFGEDGYTETGALTQEIVKDAVTYPIGTLVQVMVYQPKFYYKMVPLKLEPIMNDDGSRSLGYHIRKARYYVSDTPKEGFKLHPAFIKAGTERPYVMMSAYEGCLYDVSAGEYVYDDAQIADFANDMLSSVANVKPISNLTRRNCGVLAENRGEGWSQAYAAIVSATQLLFMIEYGTFNSQTAIGKGVVEKTGGNSTNESELAGQTTLLGNASGMASGTNGHVSISYRGEENSWGNIWKFVDGINVWGDGTMRGGGAWIADNAFAEDKRTDNYKSTGFTLANVYGFVSAFGYGSSEFDWLFLASESMGNSNLPVGDFVYVPTDLINKDRIIVFGGDWSSGFYAGEFFLVPWFLRSVHRYWYIGGRLVYVPGGELV